MKKNKTPFDKIKEQKRKLKRIWEQNNSGWFDMKPCIKSYGERRKNVKLNDRI